MENIIYNSDQLEIYLSEQPNTAPVFKAERSKDWVPFLTADGKEQYPDYLLYLFNNSALNNSIIKSKIEQVKGNGWTWDSSSANSEAMEAFMSSVNEDNEDANEVLEKISNDLEVFGGFALQITWTNDWTRIGSIKHLDFSKVRSAKVDDNGQIPGYYYSWDWSKQRSEKVFLPVFNQTTAKENKKAYEDALLRGNNEKLQEMFSSPTSQIFYYKPYRSGSFYYPLPSYVGCLNSVETDIACDNYGLSALKNGFNVSSIITVGGINTEEAKVDFAKKLYRAHTGAAKANLPMIIYKRGDDNPIEVTTLQNKAEDKIYTGVNENTIQKILTGHRVTSPLLVGIKTEGQLGASEETKTMIDFWKRTVIRPEQNVIERAWNKFMKINEFPEVEIAEFQFLSSLEEDTTI